MEPVITIGLIGGVLLFAYWVVYWYVTRPGNGMAGIVRRRPAVGRSNEKGRMSVFAVGTYAAEEFVKFLEALVRANCAGQVGGGILFELNEDIRKQIWDKFQKIGGNFPRVVWGGSPFLKHGLGNQSIDEVNRPEVRVKWAYDLKQAVTRFCAAVRRPGFLLFTPLGIFVPHAMDPTIYVALISTGGHLALAIECAYLLAAQFKADFYAVSILPEPLHQRLELLKALRLHAQNPIFRLWILTENLLDKERNDRAIALLFACITQAKRILPYADDAYNLLRMLHPKGDGSGVAVLRLWERNDVAVYPTPMPPVDFLVNWGDVVTTVLDGIYAIADDTYKCIPLATPLAGTRRCVIVNLALRQPYLGELDREIRDRLAEAGWFKKDPYLSLMFTSLGEELTSASQYVTVSVLLIEMATEGIDGVERLILSGSPEVPDSGVTPSLENASTFSTPLEAPEATSENGVRSKIAAKGAN